MRAASFGGYVFKTVQLILATALAAALLAFGNPAGAQTIGEAASTNVFPVQQGFQTVIGQSVSPPAAILNSYTLYVWRTTATLSVVPFVYEWTGDPQTNYTPNIVWTGAPVSITSTTSAPVVIPTGGITLDPSKIYVLAVRLQSPGVEAGSYAQNNAGGYAPGSRIFGDPPSVQGGGVGLSDLRFSASFSAPAPVPTLSEWAMILLGLTLAGVAALHLQRRQLTAWS